MLFKNFKDDDPQEIVIDEFIGQSIPVIFMKFFTVIDQIH